MARAARKPKDDDGGVIEAKDFDLAIRLWRQDIKPAISKVGEHNQEASSAYKQIKKNCHIQPMAAKLAFKLADMEEAKRDDFLRCLSGLLRKLNIAIEPVDLVDIAEGKSEKPKISLVTVPSDGMESDLADIGEEVAEADLGEFEPGTAAAAIKAMNEAAKEG